jgi:hypothetical protein
LRLRLLRIELRLLVLMLLQRRVCRLMELLWCELRRCGCARVLVLRLMLWLLLLLLLLAMVWRVRRRDRRRSGMTAAPAARAPVDNFFIVVTSDGHSGHARGRFIPSFRLQLRILTRHDLYLSAEDECGWRVRKEGKGGGQ